MSIDIRFHRALLERVEEREAKAVQALRQGYDDFAGYRYMSGYLKCLEEIKEDAVDVEKLITESRA